MTYVDLSIPMRSGMEACPGEPAGFFLPFSQLPRDVFTAHQLVLYTHLGTHVDAPCHFLPGAGGVEGIDLGRVVGPAMVVRANRPLAGVEVTFEDLRWPRPPRPGDRLIFDLGWGGRWGGPDYFRNHPDLSLGLIDHLVRAGVWLVALDTPTLSARNGAEAHVRLLGAGIVVVEGLVHLEEVAGDAGQIICLPLPLVGMDGSPARVLWGVEGGAS